MSADRSAYEARQAELLAALIAGDGFPEGFPTEQAAAAARALRSKRARAVAAAWPALVAELGDQFDERFDAYAGGGAGPPAEGGGLADGLDLARALGSGAGDAVRVEILFARALLAGRPGAPRRRRSPFLGAVRLSEPQRILVVLGLPGRGACHWALRFGR